MKYLLYIGGLILKLIVALKPKKKSVLDQLNKDVLKDLKTLDKELKNAIHHQTIAAKIHHTQQLNHWIGMRRKADQNRDERLARYAEDVLLCLEGYGGPDAG